LHLLLTFLHPYRRDLFGRFFIPISAHPLIATRKSVLNYEIKNCSDGFAMNDTKPLNSGPSLATRMLLHQAPQMPSNWISHDARHKTGGGLRVAEVRRPHALLVSSLADQIGSA
jgi:hypothetical protein